VALLLVALVVIPEMGLMCLQMEERMCEPTLSCHQRDDPPSGIRVALCKPGTHLRDVKWYEEGL
jgi:hypothetical protein